MSPVDVFEELLHGPVEDQPPPHDGAVFVGQEAHGQHPQAACAHLLLQRDHLLVPSFDLALHPE
jgi:hypothetical protein